MKKTKIYSILLLICCISSFQFTHVQSASVVEYPYYYFYYEDGVEITNSTANIVWWWYEKGIDQYTEANQYNSSFEEIDAYNPDNHEHYFDVNVWYFKIYIKDSIDNNFTLFQSYSNTQIENIDTNIDIYLPNYTNHLVDQTFCLNFQAKFYIVDTGLLYETETYVYFKWNPSERFNLNTQPVEISDTILYTLVGFGGLFIVIGLYWFLISCKNPYNANAKRCQKIDSDKNTKIKKDKSKEEEIRKELFGE